MSQVIIDALKNLDLKTDKWEETKRKNLRQFFGYKPDEELPKDALKSFANGNDANVFNYDLKLNKMKVCFGQYIHQIHPPTEHRPYLDFEMAKSENPENEVSAFFSDSYRITAVSFSLITDLMDSYPIRMQSQNLGLCEYDRWRDETFTRYGKQFMSQLLSVWDKLLNVEGLKPDEKKLLEIIVQKTDETFKDGRLKSWPWHHT